ncbi:hypothetical protein RFI_26266 [Reticulomyxa filosa]|uniref:Uncharacterized protein n=1 Tax=Reticulomyxa filosa TaxID=46433 RepID=X6MB68_RETFI|nr:hypothetical protein RFI_26266 [Reticulomyxa filosa]|eukprot:ETO11109.1 hypothetical protein RFI_26266 [Reticulomyxa filosa]
MKTMLSITRLLCPIQCFYILRKRAKNEKEHKDEKEEEKKAEVTIVTGEHQFKPSESVTKVDASVSTKTIDTATSTNTRTTIGIKETQSDKNKVFGRAKKQVTSSEKIKRSDIVREKGGNSKGDLNEYFVAIPKRVPTAKKKRKDGKA